MTPEKVIAAFTFCRSFLPPDASPIRGGSREQHLVFMCEYGVELVREGRHEKAFRWLGFVQGALWSMDLATVKELKNINRPSDGDA